MEKQELAHILVILVGLLRASGIISIIALIFLGAKIRYIFLTALITVGGIFTTVLSFLLGILSFKHAIAYECFAIIANLVLLYIAYRERKVLPPPKPFENTRCVVCSALIRENQEYVVLKCGQDYLFFDSEEHLKQFLCNIEDYRRFKRLNVEDPECYYVKSKKLWILLKQEEIGVDKA